MALLHNMSKECVKSELDLFLVPLTQTSIEKSVYVEIPPLTAITDSAPLEFFVSASSEDYLDLNNTYLFTRVKITRANGGNPAQGDEVGFINYPGCTMFSQVDISLGDKLITQSSNTYPYRCIIESLLNYGKDTLETQFGSGLFCMDTAGHMEDVTAGGDNEGLNKRMGYTEAGHVLEMIAPIHSDLFFQEKLLINGIDLKIRCTRAKNEFCLMRNTIDDFRVNILSASLFVKKVTVSPAVKLAHAKALMHTNVKYPIDRVCLKNFSIPAGTRVSNQDNIFLGQIPKFIVLGFVDHEAFTGSYARNPFNFQHYDLEFLCLYVDGQSYPSKPFQPNFARNNAIREYHQLFSATGKYLKNHAIAINRDEFCRGYSLFCFNLSPDEECGDHVSLIKNGNVRLEVRFRNPLQRTINLVCYSSYSSILEISARRQVLTDSF
ncbi:hypothetical protein PAMP_001046 [Pampus punctatissimus]